MKPVIQIDNEQNRHISSIAGEQVPPRMKLEHGLHHDNSHVEKYRSEIIGTIKTKSSLQKVFGRFQVLAEVVVQIPEKKTECVISQTRQIEHFRHL